MLLIMFRHSTSMRMRVCEDECESRPDSIQHLLAAYALIADEVVCEEKLIRAPGHDAGGGGVFGL